MSAPSLSLATWNMQWKAPGSAASEQMLGRLAAHTPEIICLTEAYRDVLSGLGGYQLEAEADYGYPMVEGRRKVLLWSRTPWTRTDMVGAAELPPGRFVAGRTSTALGEIDVIGMCIPWRDAHVSSGQRNRAPWEDHCAYLAGLRSILAERNGPAIMLGDFNQQVPRSRAPRAVFGALEQALGTRLKIATSGPLPPLGLSSIDHVALSLELEAAEITALDHRDDQGKLISDHFGLAVRVERHPA